jgi:predicted dienelactone hydrolase
VLEEKVPALNGKLDRDRVGVGGHSLGAFTAQVVGGATLKLGDQDGPQSLADPRVKAILQLSGQGRDQQGLHEHSWDHLKLPMMCVTGSLDRGAQGQGPEWRRDPFQYSPPGDKYFLFIEGAHHGSFTGKMVAGGLPGAGRLQQLTPEQRERLRERFREKDQNTIFEWVKQATTAFWDAALKTDATAKAWLASDALMNQSGHQAGLERR